MHFDEVAMPLNRSSDEKMAMRQGSLEQMSGNHSTLSMEERPWKCFPGALKWRARCTR